MRVIISEHSPFIQLHFNNIECISDDYFTNINSIDNVDTITVCNSIENVVTADKTSSLADSSYYYMSDIKNDIGFSDNQYTGSGLNVAVLEAAGVAFSYSHPELSNLNIHTNSSIVSDHAISVVRTLCGSIGIAPGVDDVYIYYTPTTSDYISALNDAINNDCNVINFSQGVNSYSGQYTWIDALLDYYVRHNWVTIVCSAGNVGNTSSYNCTPPGMGYNVITVASTDSNKKIAFNSSYGGSSNLNINKPTISAPGVKVETANWDSGTSISAPIVSGIVLRLIDEFPALMIRPEAIIPILVVSATSVSGQSYLSWDIHAGAGLVNYNLAREATNNFIGFSNYNGEAGSVCKSTSFGINKGTRIKVAAFWLSNSIYDANNNLNVEYNIHTDYDLKLYDGLNYVAYSSGYSNLEFLSYYNYNNLSLEIQLFQYGNKKTDITDWGAIAWCYA